MLAPESSPPESSPSESSPPESSPSWFISCHISSYLNVITHHISSYLNVISNHISCHISSYLSSRPTHPRLYHLSASAQVISVFVYIMSCHVSSSLSFRPTHPRPSPTPQKFDMMIQPHMVISISPLHISYSYSHEQTYHDLQFPSPSQKPGNRRRWCKNK